MMVYNIIRITKLKKNLSRLEKVKVLLNIDSFLPSIKISNA